jgi:hypothetical protein
MGFGTLSNVLKEVIRVRQDRSRVQGVHALKRTAKNKEEEG